ncbi:flagellar motor switch protein FliN [Persicimonas caeni]|uniref:Flagellar motor switch protein FliN n=2 Tax=Persicimonas caeni TaxID=2292766 RepID=A0A4Y6Q2S1_PERCE|nr:flagellar motor switch protein FliN [Persicimonas caeni]QED36096.1 flagellar motor switch protein FliN [Persicimonas caeni]
MQSDQAGLDNQRLVDGQHDLPGLEFLGDIPLEVTVELGRSRKTLAEILSLGPSSMIELSKAATEPLDVRVNGVLIARGEAVVVNERFGIRLTAVIDTDEVIESLKKG